jgi:LysR family glycine cleavage system transcriptional activator
LLGIAHSSVSRHVRELEGWLGAKLLDETGPGAGFRLRLTPQGEALGRLAARSFSEIDGAIASIREGRRGNAVSVSTTASLASRWLLPRLPQLHRTAPWVEVSVLVEHRLENPGKGGADLNIRMGRGPWPNLYCVPLMDDELFPVMSRERWLEEGSRSDLDYLIELTLLHDRDPAGSWMQWRSKFGPPGLDIRPGPRYSSSDLVLRAAAEGLGIALGRGRLAGHDLKSGSLVRPFGDRSLALPDAYWIVMTEGGFCRSAVETFVDWLRFEAAKPALSAECHQIVASNKLGSTVRMD